MKTKVKIGVLISGGGTNLQAIIDACGNGGIPGAVSFVGTDNPGAAGLGKATAHGIPTLAVDYNAIVRRYTRTPDSFIPPDDFSFVEIKSKQRLFHKGTDNAKVEKFLKTRAVAEDQLLAAMAPYGVDLLVLAGFMRNLTPFFIDKFTGAKGNPPIMNIHPALLPAFPGIDGYGDTYRYGCKVGGCTVHFVDYGEDSGPIIGQAAFPILETDGLDAVKQKGLALEWELYPKCIRWFAEGRIRIIKMTYAQRNGHVKQRSVVKIAQPG
ncbi:MAG: phosphoribosylglycinamide formyltransferase [Desulfobacteraceae bacterium]|nr:phosphoribosylglycinamide formyltransferase [Desulfobacteraceae bacterium]